MDSSFNEIVKVGETESLKRIMRGQDSRIPYDTIAKKILSDFHVLEQSQVSEYLNSLDIVGNGATTIKKMLYRLEKTRQIVADEEKKYYAGTRQALYAGATQMDLDMFWLVLDAMPYSRNYIYAPQNMFQLSFSREPYYPDEKMDHVEDFLTQCIYLPTGFESSRCRMLQDLPGSTYEYGKDLRIALLENPGIADSIPRIGFKYVVCIDHKTNDPEDKLVVLKQYNGEDAWADIPDVHKKESFDAMNRRYQPERD